jgi:hypothetical protein
MVVLVFAMILCVGIALAVVLAVAVPARREGRGLLTPHGEEVVARVKERTESVASATKERTGELVTAVKEKVGPHDHNDSNDKGAAGHPAQHEARGGQPQQPGSTGVAPAPSQPAARG